MTEAQKAAATGENLKVRFKGHTYSFSPDDVTVEVLEAIDDQKYTRVMRELIGPTQWAAYKSRHKSADEFNEFMVAIMEAAGNRNASSDS